MPDGADRPSERLDGRLADVLAGEDAIEWMSAAPRTDHVAVALAPGRRIGLAVGGAARGFDTGSPTSIVAAIEERIGPRWVWWDRATADELARAGVPIARCWDVSTVHRLLVGGWRTSTAIAWAHAHGVETPLPAMGQLDLLGAPADDGDPDEPVRPDGHLRPEWIAGAWADDHDRCGRWAALALATAQRQTELLAERPDPARATSTARAESAAELLCAELGVDGLPLDVARAERIIGDSIGPRPDDGDHAERLRRARDDTVLQHLGSGPRVDLRNPAEVRAMLRRIAVDVPDTRSWRLERHRHEHPAVGALIEWRKAERIATTYGYRWLDEHVEGGRLRGEWASTDGAAGRMTASAGLHNLPAELRPAIAAEPGHLLVRADLGQIEPRVLAAVSGDPALVAATGEDDLYRPVATRLRVERAVAKVAVLGAMYGATTGESAHALRRLESQYPVAMAFLERAAEAGRRGEDLLTIGGRRITMWVDDRVEGDLDRARRVAAARGRYARNAVVQGAAAELFKVWAVVVRARVRPLGARIVLCLHDELLVHAPGETADATASAVDDALAEAAHHWSPIAAVRFVADVSVIERWSDAAS